MSKLPIWVNPYLLEVDFLRDDATVFVDDEFATVEGKPGVAALNVQGEGTGGVMITYDGDPIMAMENLPDIIDVMKHLVLQLESELAVSRAREALLNRRGGAHGRNS